MANHKSSKKSVRKNIKIASVNKARRSRVRSFVKKLELAIAAGDQVGAAEAFKVTQSEMFKAVSKGIINKNAASRKISRMAARVKAIAA